VRRFWLFIHLLGFVMWLGSGLVAMTIGIASRREPRENLGVIARQLALAYRAVMMPGVLLTVASGLILTLMIYGGPGSAALVSRWLMAMQATGLLAAVLVLVFAVPAASRAAGLDPAGPQGALFDALRRKTARLGMVSGVLGLAALVTGALMR
jgi:hypothetical protein